MKLYSIALRQLERRVILYVEVKILFNVQGAYDKFPDFFRMGI